MAKPKTSPTPAHAPARPDHHGPMVAPPDARKPRRRGRRLLRLVFFLLLLLVVLVVAGPKLLSTGPGTRLLLAQVNGRIDGNLQAQSLSFAWFSGQRLDGVRYTSADGTQHLTAGSIDLPDATLWALLTGDRDLGVVRVRDLHGTTTQRPPQTPAPPAGPSDRPPNRGTAGTPPKASPGWMRGLSLELTVDGLDWHYAAIDRDTIEVATPRLTLQVPGDGAVHLQSTGTVRQGDETGRFVIDAKATRLIDVYGHAQVMQAEYNVDIALQQVPVDVAARVFGTPQRAAAVLGGNTFTVEAEVQGPVDELTAAMRVDAAHLLAEFVLLSEGEALTLGPRSSARWTLTPEGYAAFMPESRYTLEEPVVWHLQQPQLVLPTGGGSVDTATIRLRAAMRSEGAALVDAEGGRIPLTGLRLGLATDELGAQLVARFEAQAGAADADTSEATPPLTGKLTITEPLGDTPRAALRLDDVPTALIEALIGGRGGLVAALGPTVQTASARGRFVDGRLTEATLFANWDEQGAGPVGGALAVMPPATFVIDEQGHVTSEAGRDIALQLHVTPALGDYWLGQLHPVLFDAQSADRPIRVTLDGSSLRLPVGGDWKSSAVLDASIDLGTLRFGAGSLLAKVVAWAGHDGEQASFRPAAVTLRDGELRYRDLAFAVGNVEMGFEGAVDLPEQRLVEMVARVPAGSLLKVFQDLEGVIEPDDALLIPMRGPIRQPDVDTQQFQQEVVRLLSAAPRRRVEREIDDLLERVRESAGDGAGARGVDAVEDALRLLLGGKREREQPDPE
jgi:hypothetical protein